MNVSYRNVLLHSCRSRIVLAFGIASFLVIEGCGDKAKQSSESQCWNSEILRAKVGNTVFDLPAGFDFISSQDEAPPGLVRPIVRKDAQKISSVGRRSSCQDSRHVPLDFGPSVLFTYQQKNAVNSPALATIKTQRSAEINSKYNGTLAEFRRARDVKLLKSETVTVRSGREVQRNLTYGLGGRSAKMVCQVWGETDEPSGKWKSGSAFPYSCEPGIPFDMDGLIVFVRGPKNLLNNGRKPIKVDPSEWPIYWQELLNDLAKSRVSNSKES